jgi:hypothetical protein
MSVPQSRLNIPDEWANHARCPICEQMPMRVEHGPNVPDQMACPRCGASFELEQGGSRILMTAMPQALHATMAGKWVTLDEVRNEVARLLQQHQQDTPAPQAGAEATTPAARSPLSPPISPNVQAEPPKPPTPQQEQDDRLAQYKASAKELYSLGNSVEQIRIVLQRTSRLKPEDINEVLVEVSALEKARRSKQNRRMILILVLSLLLLSCCVGGALAFNTIKTNILRLTSPGTAVPFVQPTSSIAGLNNPSGDVSSVVLPAAIQTLVPPGVKVINAPTPNVHIQQPVEGSITRCPKDAITAANLFGGRANEWSKSTDGWMFIGKQPITLRVPQDMSAGYLVFGGNLEMRNVFGPAKVDNIYMAVVSCF